MSVNTTYQGVRERMIPIIEGAILNLREQLNLYLLESKGKYARSLLELSRLLEIVEKAYEEETGRSVRT